jgi:orotate phosphoribosyltransferase-like protein
MIILAKELADDNKETNLGHLFSGFGGSRGKKVIAALTDKPIEELYDLGWKKIDLPFSRLVEIANKIANDMEMKYRGVPGMILLAKELEKNNMETNLNQLFSGFCGDRGEEVIATLTDKIIDKLEGLEWEYIGLSYSRLVEIASKIANDMEKKYHGISGMISLAKELAYNNMETELNHLFRGFNKTHAAIVINTLINLKEIKGELISGVLDLQWRCFFLSLPDVLTLQNIRLDWDTRELVVQKEDPKQGLIGKETRYSMQKYNGYSGFESFIQRLKEEGIIKTKIKDRFALLMCISFDEVRHLMEWYYVQNPAAIVLEKEELKELVSEDEEKSHQFEQINELIGDDICDLSMELEISHTSDDEKEYQFKGSSRDFLKYIQIIWNSNKNKKPYKGITLIQYPEKYGAHAVYYLLRDMQRQGLSETSSINITHRIINRVINRQLYQPVFLHIPYFWKSMDLLTADYEKYCHLPGMLALFDKLDRIPDKHKVVPHAIFVTFASKKSQRELQERLNKKIELNWPNISLPYSRLAVIAKKLAADKRKKYHGIAGMLTLAKELSEDKMEINLGQLFSGFGGSRGREVIAILTDTHIDELEDIGWECVNLPYYRLVTIAKELANNPKKYRGISGMLILSKELADDNMETNLGQLFSGFGEARGKEVIATLTDTHIDEIEDLDWEKIDLSYSRLVDIVNRIANNKRKYCGIPGMLVLAKELADDNMEINLGQLFSGFGGRRGKEVIAALTDTLIYEIDDLGWQHVNLPYYRLVTIAKELANNPKKYRGISGMLILSKELADDNMETNLGQLFSGFGGRRGKEVIAALTDTSVDEIEDLGWRDIRLSYSRLVYIAEKIANDIEKKYYGISGMITLAKELAKNNSKTHLAHLLSGFNKTDATIVINTLINLKEIKGEHVNDVLDLKWYNFVLPLPDVLTLRNIRVDWDTRELIVRKENPIKVPIEKETRFSMQKYNGYSGFESFIQCLKNEHIISTKTKDQFAWLICIPFDEVRYFMKWYLRSFSVTSLNSAVKDDDFTLMDIIPDISSEGADPADIIIEREELKAQREALIMEEEKNRIKLEQVKKAAGVNLFKRLLELVSIEDRNSKEEKEYFSLLNLVKAKNSLQQSRDESIESVPVWNAMLHAL